MDAPVQKKFKKSINIDVPDAGSQKSSSVEEKPEVVAVEPVANLISFDVFFNKKARDGVFFDHHKAPMQIFLKEKEHSMFATLQQFEDIFSKY